MLSLDYDIIGPATFHAIYTIAKAWNILQSVRNGILERLRFAW